ncbi:hypothetical protein GALMADRAFT_877949 [Galerina marginata CBS 339.88]|uniref:Uncharacterized protein n=1 Tax=Galerina marginata (strain CBS 339.88) TaxID=685588 RepID=A0A067SHY3_GALM3|nr:hypothetical protein GALMADRAFT_877949 [Galerina marginata CBS 339.88]
MEVPFSKPPRSHQNYATRHKLWICRRVRAILKGSNNRVLTDILSIRVPPNSLDPITTTPSKPTHAVQEISLSTLSPAVVPFDSILCEWNGCGAIISNDNNKFAEHLVQQHDIPMHSRSETSTTPCFWKDCCEDQERWVVDDLASIVLHIEQDHLWMHRVRCPLCWKSLDRSAFKFHARADHPAVEVVP